MTSQISTSDLNQLAPMLSNSSGAGGILLVCEHASNFIPQAYARLGLADALAESHIAWDPGALGVSLALSGLLDAPLVEARASRLCYDCNRPPSASDAIPEISEIYRIAGNVGLSAEARQDRVRTFYDPFRDLLSHAVQSVPKPPVLVTIHSFTPTFRGVIREVEIGVLHDQDSRLADVMLDCAAQHTRRRVMRNAPYGPADGVTHTLKEHAQSRGLVNVMLEIRNDLIRGPAEQDAMAKMLAGWIKASLAILGTREHSERKSCQK